MNYKYDVVIVGASPDGIKAAFDLCKNEKLSIGLVSTHFNNLKKDIPSNLTLVKGTMEFTTFKYGLISVYLDNRDIVVSTDVILATGQKPKKLDLNGEVSCCLYSAEAESPTYDKDQYAVVIGNDYIAAKLSTDIAKKYKHVFLCTDRPELDCAKKYADKVYRTNNVSVMSNSKPVKCNTKTVLINGKKYETIESVEFDTYMKIDCGQLYAVLGKVPDVNGVNQTMYKLSPEGTIVVNENCESVAIPYLYAIGMISNNYNKTTYNNMLAYIQNK